MNPRRSRHDLPRANLVAERAFLTLERFLHIEAVSGIVLLCSAVLALAWANSPLAHSYHALWHMPLSVGLGDFALSQPLHFLINDVLMTVFFLVVGMEIRREIHEGALRNPKQPLRQLRLAQRELLPPVTRVQLALHPWVAYGVMPLFALANAGVSVGDIDLAVGGAQWVMIGVARSASCRASPICTA